MNELFYVSFLLCMGKNIRSTRCLFMGKNIRSTMCLIMGKNIRSTRCLFMGKNIRSTMCLIMGKNICSTRCLFMGKIICSTRCLFMGKIIRSNIDFLYVKRTRLSAHKLPIILPPTKTYYLTYNVTFRQLVSGCLGFMSNYR